MVYIRRVSSNMAHSSTIDLISEIGPFSWNYIRLA